MKNTQIILGALLVLMVLGGGYFFWQTTQAKPQTVVTASGQTVTVPTRMADINGTVLRIEGNEIVINRIISTLTAEEQAVKKARMQALSQEERQALRGQDAATAPTEVVTIVIPVGVPIVMGAGDSSGSVTESSLSEIKVGGSLSIWKENNTIIMVKIKGV